MRTLFLVLLLVFADSASVAALDGGDPRHIDFVRPFAKALEKAKAERRLIFLKPIYGGVDAAGARDYRCGNW